MSRMKSLARGYVWWPCMDNDVEKLVRECAPCQTTQRSGPSVAPVPWPWPVRKWQRIFVDLAKYKNHDLLVVVDGHSRWPEVRILSKPDTNQIISELRGMFATWGLPEELVSDNGPPFRSAEFLTFLQENAVRHLQTPTYHPSSNGLVERNIQSLKSALQKQLVDQESSHRSLQHKIDAFLFAYRNTPHSTSKSSPAEIFIGRRPRNRVSILNPTTSVPIKIMDSQEKMFRKNQARHRAFQVGEKFWVRSVTHRKESWLEGTIKQIISSVSYLVQVGHQQRYCHVDHLRERLTPPNNTEEAQGT